jgi:hypothetical protein
MEHIWIYFCNVHVKHMQCTPETSETLGTYVRNMCFQCNISLLLWWIRAGDLANWCGGGGHVRLMKVPAVGVMSQSERRGGAPYGRARWASGQVCPTACSSWGGRCWRGLLRHGLARAVIVLSVSSRVLPAWRERRGSGGNEWRRSDRTGWGRRRPHDKLFVERQSARRGKFGSYLSLQSPFIFFSFSLFRQGKPGQAGAGCAGGVSRPDEQTPYKKLYRFSETSHWRDTPLLIDF